MYVELDIQVQLPATLCGFIDGSSRLALNDDRGKHFYYPAINKPAQSITADLDSAVVVEYFLQPCSGCPGDCCRWVFIDGCESTQSPQVLLA